MEKPHCFEQGRLVGEAHGQGHQDFIGTNPGATGIGMDRKKILESYPNFTASDLKAVFAFLKECLEHELYFPISRTA